MCLATGNTPLGLYEELVKAYQEGKADFSQVRTFNLDEYVGLTEDHEQSYHYYMEEKLFKHINVPKENRQIPDGMAEDLEQHAADYEQDIYAAGGIDILLLGVGVNGHIAFNEPAKELSDITHVTDLSADTIKANSRFFADITEVPRRAVSIGVGTIMRAKRIVMMATGASKAPVVEKLLNEPVISCEFPVSLLRAHRNVTVIVDKEALGKIPQENIEQ